MKPCEVGVSARHSTPWRTGVRALVLSALAACVFSHVDAGAPGRATRAPGTPRLHYDAAALESGDVIFRTGIGLTSRLVLSADRSSAYSHAGLMAKVNGVLWVIHAEPEEDHRMPAIVKMEPLDIFLTEDRASSAAVYRALSISVARVEKAVAAGRTYAATRVPFDTHFDLSSAERLYCTELVWRAYLAAGIDLVDGRFDYLTIPLARGPYVLPSSLERSRWLTRVQTITAKE